MGGVGGGGKKEGDYSASWSSGHGVNESGQAVIEDDLIVEHQLVHGVSGVADGHRIGHERVPVVQVGKFHVDAVLELELLVAEQLGFVLESDLVLAQMLDVIFDGDLQVLSEDDQFGRLIEALIAPLRVLPGQDVADAVVLADPYCFHDEQAGHHAEERVPQRHLWQASVNFSSVVLEWGRMRLTLLASG